MENYIDDVINIARRAGQLVLQHYKKASHVTLLKDDASPVGSADLASHEFIQESLKQLGPINVLSEESAIDYDQRKSWREFWLVDPLDGTREFACGSDEFTVNIALLRDGIPVLGVVYAPAIDELYYAQKGRGSYLEHQKQCRKLTLEDSEQLIAGRGRFQCGGLIDEFLQINNITNVRVIGAALKFGRLASREISIYPRYASSKEWDIAAGSIIATEADCHVVDAVSLKALAYNKPSLANNYFIACSKSIDLNSLKLLKGLGGRQ